MTDIPKTAWLRLGTTVFELREDKRPTMDKREPQMTNFFAASVIGGGYNGATMDQRVIIAEMMRCAPEAIDLAARLAEALLQALERKPVENVNELIDEMGRIAFRIRDARVEAARGEATADTPPS